MIARLNCLMRGRHEAVRHPLGGFRCSACGLAGADLDDLDRLGAGYVPPNRRIFERKDGGTVTRTSAWEETRRGW